MKLKDLSWIFLLSILGFAYCIVSVISKVLFEWGGLAIIVTIITALLLSSAVIHLFF
nr:MAG TPA: hypothetical protein [Caudoviricetes sp.]